MAATFDDLLDRSNLTGRQFLIYAGQRLHPGLVLYNSVYSIGWPGLDTRRFQAAWQVFIDSCDALRTVVDELDGVPQQRVLPPFPTEVECVDLRRDGTPARNWIENRLQQRPLELTRCIYDTALLRTAEDEYVWFLHIHHIIVDGAAVQILIRRLTELYWGALDKTTEFPQFADHAATVCSQRPSDKYRAAREYWLNALKQVPATPHFYGVDAFKNTAQERVILTLDHAASTSLTTLARSLVTSTVGEHAVMANLFNAVFAAYLSRVSGTEQVSIGVTFHNRSSEQDRRTIGLFMEVFPILLRVTREDTLLTLISQVASCTAQALKHRQFSVGHSARAPAFSGLFNYMRALSKPLGNLDVRRVHPGHGSNAISLSVEPREDRFDLWFDVAADVAATSSGNQVAEHLRTLLVGALHSPDSPLSRLSLLSQPQAVLAACTGPSLHVDASPHGCLGQFQARVTATPNAVALTFADTQLSYAELNKAAKQLAGRLRSLGARRGKRIGICLERSPDMVIAVLAVLKTGAAYVPLDPTYPQARLRTMLGDADPVVLVTTEKISASLPPYAAQPLFIDQPGDRVEEYEALNIAADDIAYVIYTSGSTGTPKGVLVAHGNVSNHLAWRYSFFPLQPSDRCLQTASLSFDDSVWEILEPLCAGANLVLTRPRFEYDSTYLVKLMVDRKITVACFVPSLLRAIIEAPEIGQCHSLRRLTTGGEGLSIPLQQRVRERLPDTAFYNGYGTTEATIASIYWRCEITPGQTTVPIGRPIANTQAYILDPCGQLVPPGVLGEICLGGVGIARGYLNRPELTAQAFVDDRFGAVPGAKLYRTGDVGRLRSDGVFEFAGRVDDQIKIRGIRVELGDIEAALLDHPDVRSAAVVCNDTASGKRLIAYVVPRGSDPVPGAELRAFVRDRIPPALIPNRFETIAALPLTPSGKLDRRALPSSSGEEEPGNYVPPRNELESQLVSLWEGVLQARPIGIRDDFFELGGHSLSAVQIAAAIGKMMDRALSPGLLFETPTIETLSGRLATAKPGGGAALVPLAEGNSGAPLFLIHHISGDITAYRDLAHHLGAGHTIYGVRVPELDTNEKPLDRVEDMAARYIAEIRAVQPQGPYLLGGHSAGAHIAFEMARQLSTSGERVKLLAILEADARRPGGQRGWLDYARHQLETVKRIPGNQRATYLWRKFTLWLNSTPPTCRPEDSTKNAVWSAMERAVREYRPRPYPGSITLFRAMDRSVTGTYSRTLGWGRLARGGVRVIDVPGTHSTVLRPGSEPPMAAKLRDCLDELTADQFT